MTRSVSSITRCGLRWGSVLAAQACLHSRAEASNSWTACSCAFTCIGSGAMKFFSRFDLQFIDFSLMLCVEGSRQGSVPTTGSPG
jgi:hypothetical protein